MIKRGSLLLALVLLAATLINWRVSSHTKETIEKPIDLNSYENTLKSLNFFLPQPASYYGISIEKASLLENKVKPRERLADIFLAHNVPANFVKELASVKRNIFDVRKILPNKKYAFIVKDDSLRTPLAFVYEPNPVEYFVFRFDEEMHIETCKREIEVIEREASGIIYSSLSHTIESLGISYELTNKFVDIFAWQLDFQRLAKGDKFKIIYEELVVEDKPIGIGKIIGIYFEHYGNDYYAFNYNQGDGIDYFDEKGNSLRKALLKYPIEFTRISSRYSLNRFHPVQKTYKAHLGTDFAAPTGTPIRTVGDGIVVEASYNNANGNYVKIRHNATYTTQYLHMSKIAAGLKPGMKVRQGQTIGYVGSTGLATGPHLCYRFWKNGVQVDALRVELPPSQPIKEENSDSFDQAKQSLIARLNQIQFKEEANFMMARR
ncbi:MAG TPA: peptidoglycan DD-metalloendopeptidase family protein [Cyclobacteriaceae bacterium]|nr:peptidoglycan DD-metalloendopeptidase family protein [Cyclobacteriaceae bacterium]